MEPVVVISLLLNAITVMLVVWLVYRGDKTITEFKPHVSEIIKIKEDLLEESRKAIAQSVEVAKQIVRTTQENADKTLQHTDQFFKQLQAEVSAKILQTISEEKLSLQKGTQQSLDEYRSKILELLTSQQETSRRVQEELLSLSKAKLDEISRIAPDGVLNLHTSLDQKIKEKIDQADKEIEVYRTKRMRQIDEKIYQTIAEIAKKTIGRSIDISSHEELVMQALEKARKEKVV